MGTTDYTPVPEPLLLSVPEAAEVLRIHRATVFALLRDGDLESIQIGRRRLIPLAAIHRFIRARSSGLSAVDGAMDPEGGRP